MPGLGDVRRDCAAILSQAPHDAGVDVPEASAPKAVGQAIDGNPVVQQHRVQVKPMARRTELDGAGPSDLPTPGSSAADALEPAPVGATGSAEVIGAAQGEGEQRGAAPGLLGDVQPEQDASPSGVLLRGAAVWARAEPRMARISVTHLAGDVVDQSLAGSTRAPVAESKRR